MYLSIPTIIQKYAGLKAVAEKINSESASIYSSFIADLESVQEVLLKDLSIIRMEPRKDNTRVRIAVINILRQSKTPLTLKDIYDKVNPGTGGYFKKSGHLASRLKTYTDKGIIKREMTHKGFVYSINGKIGGTLK